jgi:multicomponent Na+:H+ antiporter subunit D
MNAQAWLPVSVFASSFVPGLIIFTLPEELRSVRTLLNLSGATVKLILVGVMLWGVHEGRTYATAIPLLPGLDLRLRAAALPMFFVTLSAVLWLVTTIYAIGYLEGEPNRSRFFGYFSLCVSSTVGIAMADDLLSLLVFYEMLTLTTYPLVVHRGTQQAMQAGRTYLIYTLSGSALLLLAIAWLYGLTGDVGFREAGKFGAVPAEYATPLRWTFAMLIGGFGVKAALVPLHSWLPKAMVAPAPVSALLHAVAVVKAGAFGIVRVVTDIYGIQFARDLGVLLPLALVAAATILYGSLQALRQDELKKRLAFSTVSQISYIVLGVALGTPLATIGGIVHLVHQGLMKVTLFFCAGNLARRLHIHHIQNMDGVARRMPWTMAAFTVGALGMIGVPPVAGFVSKWYLALGAMEAGQIWAIPLLVVSSLLNAAYFLPIVYRAWFKASIELEVDRTAVSPGVSRGQLAAHGELPAGLWRQEVGWSLLAPPLFTAALAVLAGLFAASDFSPLAWATIVSVHEFGS